MTITRKIQIKETNEDLCVMLEVAQGKGKKNKYMRKFALFFPPFLTEIPNSNFFVVLVIKLNVRIIFFLSLNYSGI